VSTIRGHVPPGESGLGLTLTTLLGDVMDELNVSARALETKSGVKNQVIGRVRNATVDPRCSTLGTLFTALGVEVEVVVRFKPPKRPVAPKPATS
jgi:hypothetical protein